VGMTIRMLRTAKGISQGDIARKLGVNASYLSLVEHDRREPSVGFLRKLADFFEIPVGFLLLGDAGNSVTDPVQRHLLDQIHQGLTSYILSRNGRRKSANRRKRAQR